MAFSTTCCLNLPPLPSSLNPSDSNTKPSTQLAISWPRNIQEWRRQCVVGTACMVVGLQMGDFLLDDQISSAVAKDMVDVVAVAQSNSRWSEKRMCPPWRGNPLETIVPENLPRPSARRRWERVDFTTKAPAVEGTVQTRTRTDSNCFSM